MAGLFTVWRQQHNKARPTIKYRQKNNIFNSAAYSPMVEAQTSSTRDASGMLPVGYEVTWRTEQEMQLVRGQTLNLP